MLLADKKWRTVADASNQAVTGSRTFLGSGNRKSPPGFLADRQVDALRFDGAVGGMPAIFRGMRKNLTAWTVTD